MIVVLDTNVIISSVLSTQGHPAEIIQRWERGELNIATSPPLLAEIERVLNYEHVRRYFKQPDEKVNSFVERLRKSRVSVDPDFILNVVEADHDDDRVLECAVAANADYIVSGDKHLLDLGEYEGIQILAPAGFIAVLNLEETGD